MKSGTDDLIIYTDIEDEIEVFGDASKLRRAMANLVGNAMEALSDLKLIDGNINISTKEEQLQAVITVRDNGPGIPADILDKLFEPFITKNKSNGTGLRLAIVKQYIGAHGGSVLVRNEGGAVFDIRLPIIVQDGTESMIHSALKAVIK